MSRVLFCPVHATSFVVMKSLALSFLNSGRADPVFLLGESITKFQEAELHKFGFKVIRLKTRKNKSNRSVTLFVLNFFPFNISIFNYFKMKSGQLYKNFNQYFSQIQRVISEMEPVSVIVPDDRSLAGGLLPALFKACAIYKVKIVIPTISYVSRRKNLTRNRDIVNKKNFKKFPNQLHFINNKNCISFYSFIDTYTLDFLGVLPGNPWVVGGGSSDVVMTEGVFSQNRLLSDGCASGKIRIVGHIEHDSIFKILSNKDTIKRSILNKYNFSESILVVVSLPQLGEHKAMSWDKHWEEINFLCKVLCKVNGVAISLHPKMDKHSYSFIESQYKIPILEESLKEVIPVADIFIAAFSSTVDWAVLCSVPSIVLDLYGSNLDMFRDYRGVVVVKKRKEFIEVFNRIVFDSEYRQTLAKSNKAIESQIAVFDGNCSERILEICSNPKPH